MSHPSDVAMNSTDPEQICLSSTLNRKCAFQTGFNRQHVPVAGSPPYYIYKGKFP